MQDKRSGCSIEKVGKQRNGKPRYWCIAHGRSATGRHGSRLSACEGAAAAKKELKVLDLNADRYPGGIGIWGAVEAVYDTTDLPPESGIHVHARDKAGGSKEIDDTFDAVAIASKKHSFDGDVTITSETAINYYLSRFLKRDVKSIRCPLCDREHLDAGLFAIKPHRRHLCLGCGRFFNDSEKGISNPVASLSHALGLPNRPPATVRAPKTLNIRQSEFRGGIQIWASNPALLWTSERPEEEGIHVHLYRSANDLVVDDTFDKVSIDGIELNEAHVQSFMAQQVLEHLSKRIVSLICPRCDSPHFDEGELGFSTHSIHKCTQCRHKFSTPGRRRLVVSNPFVAVRQTLQANAV
jgi:transposase-like protein